MKQKRYIYFGLKLLLCILFTIVLVASVNHYVLGVEQMFAIQQMEIHATKAYEAIQKAHDLKTTAYYGIPVLWLIAWIPDVIIFVMTDIER